MCAGGRGWGKREGGRKGERKGGGGGGRVRESGRERDINIKYKIMKGIISRVCCVYHVCEHVWVKNTWCLRSHHSRIQMPLSLLSIPHSSLSLEH